MKKTVKLLGLVFLAVVLAACSGLAGCAKKGKQGVLSIAAFEGGNGKTYAAALADAFQKYRPDITVEVDCNPMVPESAQTALEANASTVDVYMVNGLNIGALCENSDGALASLNDVYASLPKTDVEQGETAIERLITPEILPYMRYGGDRQPYVGNYYAIPTASNPHGLVLNKTCLDDVLGKDNWRVPRTSDELIALCDAVQLADKTVTIGGSPQPVYPFIYAGNAVEYWRYVWYVWIAQYDGYETFSASQSCKKDGQYDKSAYFTDGKKKALETLETIITRANDYCHPDSMSNKHTLSQKYFLQGRAAMMAVGDWLENDTETEYKPELMMVKTPILSDVADLLGLTGTRQEKDAALSSLVEAVDSGAASDPRLTPEAFEKLREARSMVFSLGSSQIAAIPANSVNLELAKDFLRFLYSQEGFEILLRETGGARLPVASYPIPDDFAAGMTTFGKSVRALADADPTYIYLSNNDPIRYRAGLGEFLSNEKPEVAMGKKTNAQTASAYWEAEKRLMDNQWNAFISQVS